MLAALYAITMNNELILGVIFLLVASSSFASKDDYCSDEFKNSILGLRDAGSFSESMKFKGSFKSEEIEFEPLCIIGNPAMSDGMRYTVISYKNKPAFLINEWNGLNGHSTIYGPFESKAYNKVIKDRLRLDALNARPL